VPHRLLRLTAAALLLSSPACRLDVDVSKVAALMILVDADPDTIAIGDSTALVVRAVNATYDTVRFGTGSCDPLGVEIRTTSGDPVVPAALGCETDGSVVFVPPMGTIRARFVWRGERGLGTEGDPGRPLAPGVYRVRGFLNADGAVRFGDPTPVWLTSP